ncbi:MAG: hypothetical protein RMK19_00440 [Bacteroidia bacterium]|nr:hypothetical protein [Bacteroidia bacterium]MDW8014465.1 hypothetical protein [Bacteroidia bacterium]
MGVESQMKGPQPTSLSQRERRVRFFLAQRCLQFLILLIGGIWGQPPSPLPEAYEALERRLTVNAQRLLARAREHPDSLVRWEAALLEGYLAARAGKEKEALHCWYFVSQQSPSSPLGLEAMYWRADLLLRHRLHWESGLYLLRLLLENPSTSPTLRRAVEERLAFFFWRESNLGFLWTYAMEGHPLLYPYLLPALLYHLRQGCYWRTWRLWETFHTRFCGEVPDTLRWAYLTHNLPLETLRVALLLPLMAAQERSSPFLEFWQGFEEGLADGYSPYTVWEVYVEDSERSPIQVQQLLDAWDSDPPHIIVGEVSWSLNQLIGAFCERKGTWHAVPINPASPLRRLTFPLTLPASCVGQRIAELLVEHMPLQRYRGALLYEAEAPQAKAFLDGFRQKLWVPAYEFPSTLQEAVRRWSLLRDSLRALDWYGILISQEEVAGFLLHKLGRDTLPPLVIGMEDWMLFQRTSFRDYRRVRLWIPHSAVPDSNQWERFAQRIRQGYGQKATLFHAQGYDAARCLIELSRVYVPGEKPMGECAGLLNFYTFPPDCQQYRLRIWEYDKGERFLRYER